MSQGSRRRGLTAGETAAWRGLLRVHAHVVDRQDAELRRRHGVSVTEWEVLRAVSQAPGGSLRVGDIGGLVLLTTGGVTRLVTRLELRGLVVRTAHEVDRRGVAVRLTDAGSTLQRKAAADLVAIVRDAVLGHWSEDQVAALVDLWEAALPGSATADDVEWASRRR